MAQAHFTIVEATIDDIHAGYQSGQLTCRHVVQMYLDRIAAFDKQGPHINALITINAETAVKMCWRWVFPHPRRSMYRSL